MPLRPLLLLWLGPAFLCAGWAQSGATPQPAEGLPLLDESRWQSELYVEEISARLGVFFGALKEGNLKQVSRQLLAPSFQGGKIGSATVSHREGDSLRLFSFEEVEPEAGLSSSAFLTEWTRYAQGFEEIDWFERHISQVEVIPAIESAAVYVRVTADFRITGRDGEGRRQDQGTLQAWFTRGPPLEEWRLRRLGVISLKSIRGAARFTDVTATLPLTDQHQDETMFVAYFAEGISLADVDGDQDLDLFVPRRYDPVALLLNDGYGKFQDASQALGLADLTGVRSGYFLDWDNDGDLDLLAITRERMYLFENQEGRFADVSQKSFFNTMFNTGLVGAAVADYDRDGWLDFYVYGYGDPNRGPGFGYFDSTNGFFNKLFRNHGDGTFWDVTEDAGLQADNSRWTYGALWIDQDQDGSPDLYVINDYGPNQLFRNQADGTFVDVAQEAGATDYGNGMGGSWADYDNDGKLDLFIANMHSYSGQRITGSASFRGEGETLRQAQRFAKGNTLYRAKGDGTFEEVTSAVTQAGWAWGNVFFDYDNDGDQDLYVANGMFSNTSQKDT